jgi:hypothetical protein
LRYRRAKNIANAQTFAAWDDTNPYNPPHDVLYILTLSSAWQGRNRQKTSLNTITDILSEKRKHNTIPIITTHQRRGSLRNVTAQITATSTMAHDHP